MKYERKPIENAIEELKVNLDTVARVYEWARLMRYENPKIFSRHFLRHFKVRPEHALKQVRICSILRHLRMNGHNKEYREVAWNHSLPDGKALYNYLRRHLDCSPTEIKTMTGKELQALMDGKFGECFYQFNW